MSTSKTEITGITNEADERATLLVDSVVVPCSNDDCFTELKLNVFEGHHHTNGVAVYLTKVAWEELKSIGDELFAEHDKRSEVS